jgi:hypothetical protein
MSYPQHILRADLRAGSAAPRSRRSQHQPRVAQTRRMNMAFNIIHIMRAAFGCIAHGGGGLEHCAGSDQAPPPRSEPPADVNHCNPS